MHSAAALPNSPHLWPIAQRLHVAMTIAIGAPGLIAAIETLTRALRRKILSWLAPMECAVRKLLLLEAQKLPRPRSAPITRTQRKPRLPARRKIFVIDPARPSTWRASFRVLIPADPTLRRLPDTHGPRIRRLTAETVREIWQDRAEEGRIAQRPARLAARRANALKRLAIRCEALRRVLEDPTRAIERLAARLFRMKGGEPQRAARRLANAPIPRCDRGIPQSFFDAIKLHFTRSDSS